MMEILVLALIVYLGLKVAWWLVKATLYFGLAALVLAAFLVTPWVWVF